MARSFNEKPSHVEQTLSENKKTDRVSTEPETRAHQKRRDTDSIQDISVSLEDIDEAIMYQFEKRFNFELSQNGTSLRPPVIWDNAEDWVWAKKLDRIKTLGDRILLPLIIINRTSVTRDSDLDIPTNRWTFNEDYSAYINQHVRRKDPRNRFNETSTVNKQAVNQTYVTHIPKYIECSYDVKIMTEYQTDMNNIVERIQYFSDQYWGDPNGYRFLSTTDDTSSEAQTDDSDNRYIEANISITTKGYILPKDSLYQSTTDKQHSVREIQTTESVRSKQEFYERFGDTRGNKRRK